MTREEAIMLIQAIPEKIWNQLSKYDREAFGMAFDALSQPEIIYCRDCKNLEIDSIYHDLWCDGKKVWFDHYCGYAERRTDE